MFWRKQLSHQWIWMKRKQVLSKIETAIKNVSLHGEMKGLILGENDPSYKHRYRLAVEFWKEATGERVIEGNLEKIKKDVKVNSRGRRLFSFKILRHKAIILNSDASDGKLMSVITSQGNSREANVWLCHHDKPE